MVTSSTVFNPKEDGFKFANKFAPKIKVNFPLIGEIEIQNLMTGLCGGMCYTALDYFHKGMPAPSRRTVPKIGSGLHIHLVRKQIESLIPPDGVIKVLDWSAREKARVWRHTGGREFGKLRTRLDKGEPAVLALIRAARGDDPRKNHQVVAHAYRSDGQTQDVEIGIYDPNHPEEGPTISMNVRNPKRGINIIQSTGEPLRGFFVIDYKPGDPPN